MGRLGFVFVEMYFNVPIISSDCQNGPKEILENGIKILFSVLMILIVF